MRRLAARTICSQVGLACAAAPSLQLVLRYNSGAAAAAAAAGAEQGKETDLPLPCEKTTKIAILEQKIKELEEKNAELKKDVLYQAAETENVRRIGREDVEKARNFSVTAISKDMLEVVDTLEKGVEAFEKLSKDELEKNRAIASIYTGVKLSANVLMKNLGKHGIEKMPLTVGEKFDPNRHEALFKTPVTAEIKADHVSNVLKPGYMLKERVLRAAQVGVAEDS